MDEGYRLRVFRARYRRALGAAEAKAFDPWSPDAIDYGMASAYKAVLGAEPDFTNFAQIKGGAPFVDTLDYIFVSPGMTPVAVDPLPAREDVGGPLPNADEPSDHIMLGAEIQLA